MMKDYIKVYPILNKKQCFDLINKYDSLCIQEATSATKDGNVVLKDHRDCSVLPVDDPEIDAILYEALAIYKKEFSLCNVTKRIDSQFLRYGIGGKFNAHVDSYGDAPRSISMSVILNDNFTGGEFAFFDKTGYKELFNYPAVAGDVLIFPSNYMYPHAVKPVKFGIRYAVVNWLN